MSSNRHNLSKYKNRFSDKLQNASPVLTFRYFINRSSWRKRGVASTPLLMIPGFFLHFSLEPSYGYLRFEGNGKIPLGRQGKWRGKEWALDRHTQIFISTHFSHRPRWPNWLVLHSANSMVMGSNPTASNSKFCYFFILALPFSLLFPYLPKGIFPFPSNLRQPQLGSNKKAR